MITISSSKAKQSQEGNGLSNQLFALNQLEVFLKFNHKGHYYKVTEIYWSRQYSTRAVDVDLGGPQ